MDTYELAGLIDSALREHDTASAESYADDLIAEVSKGQPKPPLEPMMFQNLIYEIPRLSPFIVKRQPPWTSL